MAHLWPILSAVVWLTLVLAVLSHLLRYRRRPESALLWLLVVMAFPFAGAILYAMFGVTRVPRAKWLQADTRRAGLLHAREVQPRAYWLATAPHRAFPADPWEAEVDRTFSALTHDTPLLSGNLVTPLATGDEAFPEMLDAIAEARHHIHLQSFIIGNDAVGRAFLDALAQKARGGVRVRVLYDRFGSSRALWTGLFRRYACVPNLSLAGWTQANFLRKQLQFNLRNHSKNLVVDGRIAFLGGINLTATERSSPGHPAIRDYHFRVLGPVVQQLQYSFLRDWHVMTGEDPAELLSDAYFRNLPAAGAMLARATSTGPTASLHTAADLAFQAITSARRSLLAVTPYFLPSDDLLRALRLAAIRGVAVDLLLPARSNHPYTAWAARSTYDDLLAAGVRIHERRPPFIHAKAMVIDDQMSVIGSSNWDQRSLESNFETGLVVYGKSFAESLKAMAAPDLADSTRITFDDFHARPRWHRYVENTAALLAPLL
ncbi:MAG: cardiolipin synthase [Kiritimatiellae bacterium]|nr:cardiolipin synthase [Kiritimatiellia bacterium]